MHKCWCRIETYHLCLAPNHCALLTISELPLAAWITTIKEMRHFVFWTALWLFPTFTQECLAAKLSIFLPVHPLTVQKVTCHRVEGKSLHFKKPALVSPQGQNMTCTEFLNLNVNPLALYLSTLSGSEQESSFLRITSGCFLVHSSSLPSYLSLRAPPWETGWKAVGMAL